MKERIASLRRAVQYFANEKKSLIVDLDVLAAILGSGNKELTIDELTERFDMVKEQRDRFLSFCRVVCPTSDGSFSTWDHETGNLYRELVQRDKDRLLTLLRHCLGGNTEKFKDEIRNELAKSQHHIHPSRLLEALHAIAEPAHALTKHTAQGLRDIAQAALNEIDPKNDYSSCTGPGAE